MKVILLQDIKNTGKQGDVITVSDGYARNYLYPRKLAVEAAGGALKDLEVKHAMEERKNDKLLVQAEAIRTKLEEAVITVKAKTGVGKLYGRITAQDIADALERDLGVKLDRRKVHLNDPIKSTGNFEIPLKLHKDITIELKVAVVGE
jgi:large subunit ribosomal protein L9